MFPAQAGTQTLTRRRESTIWIPAFAGNAAVSWENSLARPHQSLKRSALPKPPDQNPAAIHRSRQLDRGGIGSLKAHTAEIGQITDQQYGSLPSSLSGFASNLYQPRAKALAAKVWVDSEGAQKDQGYIAYVDRP